MVVVVDFVIDFTVEVVEEYLAFACGFGGGKWQEDVEVGASCAKEEGRTVLDYRSVYGES